MTSSPPEPSGWKRPVAFWIAVLSVVAGVAQLGVFPARFSRALLIAVVLTALLHLVVWVWQYYYVAKVRQLRAQLAREASTLTEARVSHQHYVDAIERTSDREKPLFTETLEVTVCIGDDDESDLVIERRVTTPDPLVTNRTMRPIVPTDEDQIIRLDEIGFTTYREGGGITTLPLREQINKLRVWLVFDPALSAETEWRVEYRPVGLWRPLRRRGWDVLAWDDRLNGSPSAFTSFAVVFKFPAGDQPPSVKERQGYGELDDAVADPDGTWRVVWRDPAPSGHYYVWDLTQPPRSP